MYEEMEHLVAGRGNATRVMEDISKVVYATMDDGMIVDDNGVLMG